MSCDHLSSADTTSSVRTQGCAKNCFCLGSEESNDTYIKLKLKTIITTQLYKFIECRPIHQSLTPSQVISILFIIQHLISTFSFSLHSVIDNTLLYNHIYMLYLNPDTR